MTFNPMVFGRIIAGTCITRICIVMLFLGAVACQKNVFREVQIPDHQLWPRPEIVPVPVEVSGVHDPVVSLNGTWKFNNNPPENFWRNDVEFDSWYDIRVPAQASFHIAGLTLRRNAPIPSYVYKKVVEIPGEFDGKRVKLRFQGVTGDATVWVNGTEAGTHHGGFTIWNPDITDLVTPGQEAVITVSVHEPASGQSTNTYSGGIIRGVDLIAVPENHITRFHIDSDLDNRYRDAMMNVWVAMAFGNENESAEIRLTMRDPGGEEIALSPSRLELSQGEAERIVPIPVSNPMKWSAEHPHLYTIRADLLVNGSAVQTLERRIGFRKIEIDGQKLLVNGNEVKLRGSAQFDSHPLNGISLTREEVIRDLTLYKEANHNHIRPSCYIANEEFLAAADSIGIYVAGEMPVTFAAVAARDEFLLPIFMNQTAETIEQARNHPSIILWTLANETTYGFNIGKMAEYVFNEDPSLPVLFSWSQTVPEDVPLPYNIYSYHYPDYDDDLAERGVSVFNNPGTEREIPPMPVLADEFAHPASYNYEEMRLDPNVRNFWGETIKIFWERMATTHGSLGGAIFAGIDHPRTLTAEFPWGLLDKWRRAKPEYWLTKKAYSPVRVEKEQVYLDDTEALAVPVKNWFDHTNLNETTFTWSVGESTETTQGPDVPPHGAGNILIPFNGLQPGDIINLKINLSRDNRLIDEYNIPVDPEPHSLPSPEGPAPEVSEDAQSIVIAGEDFQITFNKQSGLIASGSYNGVELIKDGPYLHIIGADLSDWKHTGLSTSVEGNETVVTIDGTYQARPEIPRGFGEDDGAREPVTVETTFEVRIDGQGLINTRYQIHQFPLKAPETRLVPWNRTNAGGYEEVGIRFLLDDSIHSLSWKRNGLWSAYPEDHIGRNEGVAPRTTENEKQVGIEPGWPWSLDEKDFNLFGPDDPGNRGTNDFRSMKENIYEATALTPVGVGVKVLSDGAESVRLELAGTDTATGVWMHINNEWNYRHLGLGNYMKPPILIEDGYSDNIYTRFVGR